jgi:hypothetical protein
MGANRFVGGNRSRREVLTLTGVGLGAALTAAKAVLKVLAEL